MRRQIGEPLVGVGSEMLRELIRVPSRPRIAGKIRITTRAERSDTTAQPTPVE
jgi:hypothetical protein